MKLSFPREMSEKDQNQLSREREGLQDLRRRKLKLTPRLEAGTGFLAQELGAEFGNLEGLMVSAQIVSSEMEDLQKWKMQGGKLPEQRRLGPMRRLGRWMTRSLRTKGQAKKKLEMSFRHFFLGNLKTVS